MDSPKTTEDAGDTPVQANPELTSDQTPVEPDQDGVPAAPFTEPDDDTPRIQEPETREPGVDKPEIREPAADAARVDATNQGARETATEPTAAAPEPADLPPADGFGDLGLAPAVARAIAELGYESTTAIQRECIPHLLAGRDLLGQAQTGTGKTAAFALPLLSRLDANCPLPQVLVLTPTRELALQVAEAFQRYAHYLKDFQVLPIYGGQSYGLQVRQLQRVPQVVVGTPGRIMDHMRRATLSLSALKTLVLDEADEMLNMGFAEDIDWIFEHTPPERQVALFSATMPQEILRVARDHLNDPVEVRIHSATATVDTIDQQHCVVTRFHKVDVLTRILELETFDAMLIFVRTKGGTTELADRLRSQGFAAEALNGDMNQEMRERTVERIKGGKLDILVATDVAARGLDVERISHVVNFDIPTDPSAYVHRIGRTGRAGRTGKAILLVEPRERGLLRSIERTIRRSIPEMNPPSAAQLSASRIDRFTAQLRETLTEQDLDFFYRLIARIEKEQELNLLDIAAAASYLIQRERPLEVKETPREPRRDNYREGGYERPRRQDGGRPFERPYENRPRRDQDDRGPRPERDAAGGERRYDNRAERPAPAYNRERTPGRDDRPPRADRGGQPSQVPYQGERAQRPDERPFPRDREGRGDPPRFDRGPSPARDDRGFRPERDARPPFRDQGAAPFRERDGNRDSGRSDPRDDDRGNRFPQGERDRPQGDYRDAPRTDTRPPRDRDDRGHRDRPDLIQHRIEVGHRDGVTPREIVGAIANESGLEGRFIGHIDIQDDHAIVDLPAGMPREIFSHLKRVFIRGRALQISVLDGPHRPPQPRRDDQDGRPPRPRDDGRAPAPRRFGGEDGPPRGPRPDQGFPRKRRD
ncbi:MAG: DEAD/DEAH box helicase [Lamprocystis purpurea]|jgi:ATP-dependent RNA helicase DeaD|nr:DEAD/DEAH box helicase [Lamprocystis purpurea]MBV5273834.1 DEAD/DEAH box helicase [Lamprocystis purpurea]